MEPREGRDSGQIDFLLSRLDAIIDVGTAGTPPQTMEWPFLGERFDSDEVLCDAVLYGDWRWTIEAVTIARSRL